jgi:ribosomal protein L32
MAKVKYNECPSCGAVIEGNTCKYCGNALTPDKIIYDEGFYSINEKREKIGLRNIEDNLTCSFVLFNSYILNSYNILFDKSDGEWRV